MPRTALALACSLVLAGCANRPGIPGAEESITVVPPTEGIDSPTAPALASSSPTARPPDPAFLAERAQHAYATGRWDVAEGY